MKKLLILLLLIIGAREVRGQADPYHDAAGQAKTPIIKYIDADFGANPNDAYDDTKAFDSAAKWFSNVSANNVDYNLHYGVLQLSSGIYIVDSQKTNNSIGTSQHINHDEPVFQPVFGNLDGLIIEGTGIDSIGNYLSKIKIRDSAYFGCFSKSSPTDPHIPAYGNSSNADATSAGWIFLIGSNAKNVIIRNIEMNGNSTTYKMGSRFEPNGDYSSASRGIHIFDTKYISLENLYIHNFGEDGIILDPDHNYRATPGRWNATIDNVKSYWNGRQALSWTGGYDIRVQNSEFSYTRMQEGTFDIVSQVAGSPGCNIDIEADYIGNSLGIIRNGLFKNCKMIGNADPAASIAIQLDCDSLTFDSCQIKANNTINGNWAAIGFQSALHRNFTFNSCEILGNIDFMRATFQYGSLLPNGQYSNQLPNEGYTRFNQCYITESISEQFLGDYSFLRLYDRVNFDKCTIKQVNARPIFEVANNTFNNNDILIPDNFSTFNNCNFISTYNSVTNIAPDLRGRMYNLRFTGNTQWTHDLQLSSIDGQALFFQNVVLNGSNMYSPMNTFTFPNVNVFEGKSGDWRAALSQDIHSYERPIIIGETPCEYLQVYIGENSNGRSVVRNFGRPLYIGEGVTLTVRRGSALILSGNVYLAGKIIVENGAYLKYTEVEDNNIPSSVYPGFGTPPTIHFLGQINQANIDQHIVLNGQTVNTDPIFLYTSTKYAQPLYASHSLRSQLMAPNEYLRSEVASNRFLYDAYSMKCPQCILNTTTQQYDCTPINGSLYYPFKATANIASSSESDIQIYPNPTNDKLYISTNNTNETTDIQLLDINGRQLYKTSSKDAEVEISLSKYPQGTYLIRISNASNSVVKKVVKTN